ncbi:CAP domain-containing protein [Kurthia zopfii]|uniref:CAP domain-containing protein n=1 Tax=Kurthia zopfii TaxID=1650 RepID=UPI000F6D8E04|nr:CAP domain-containing protein [Kurthia zopfii]VEI05454.1 uncharacterized protein, YkwD family [Kurthia zopfii]
MYKNGKLILLGIMLLLFTLSLSSSKLKTESANAKKPQQMIYIDKKLATYKSKGKGKQKKRLSAGVYLQYGKSGSWRKVKNNSKKYVWVKSSKAKVPTKNNKYYKTEQEIIRLVNKERAKYKLKSLKQNRELGRIAMIRSEDMASLNYFGHTSPTYGRWSNLLYSSEYPFKFAGENLAAGFSKPKEYVNAWMASPTHRDNILNKRFTKIAVAIAPGKKRSKYPTYATQWFAQ